MNYIILFSGAAIVFAIGYLIDDSSWEAVGLALMWIGFAVITS